MKRICSNKQIKRLLPFLSSLLLFTSIINIVSIRDVKNDGSIVGEVVSIHGPVPQQIISLKRHEGRLLSEIATTITDGAGKYKFENLPLNASFILELKFNGTRHFKVLTTNNTIVRADFNLVGTLMVKIVHVNRTAVGGLLINLEGLPGVILANTTTDKNGISSFNHLDLNEKYRVSFIFYGVPYYKDVRFKDATSTKVNFTIYETTTSDGNIKINLHHIFVKLEEGYLSVLENIIYKNDGIMVFNNSWLKAWLPKDRLDFTISIMDCCVQQVEDGILLNPMDPIKPGGQYLVWMEYKAKVFSSDYVFKKRVDYNTDSFYFFLDDSTGVNVERVTGLTPKGTVTLENIRYALLAGSDLKAGTYISVKLSGLATSQKVEGQFIMGVILLAIPVGFFLSSILIKARKETSVKDLEVEKLSLFEKIAKLESEYIAGNIFKEKYEKLRSKYKRHVIELMRQIDKLKADQIEPSVPSSLLLRDLYLEEQALTSTLEKLKADFRRGLVSKEGYDKIKTVFEDRRIALREKIKRLEKTEGRENERQR